MWSKVVFTQHTPSSSSLWRPSEGSPIKNSCSASRRYLSTCSTKQLTLLTGHRHASRFSGKQEKMWQKTDKEGNSDKRRTVKFGQLRRVITQEPNEILYGEINL